MPQPWIKLPCYGPFDPKEDAQRNVEKRNKFVHYEPIDRPAAHPPRIAEPALFPATSFNRQSFSRRLHRYVRTRNRATRSHAAAILS